MCDKVTRIWCCRIGLVFSVFGVLSMMLFQIWNYYFSLVQQMDEQTIEYPRIHAILSFCNRAQLNSWNIDRCLLTNGSWTCSMLTPLENNYIIDPPTNIIVNNSHIIMFEEICQTIKIWILPW
jgi:hypothetical protein